MSATVGHRERRSHVVERLDHRRDHFEIDREHDGTESLLPRQVDAKKLSNPCSIGAHHHVGFSFSVSKLALIPFVFLVVCHIILARQCIEALIKKYEAPEPIVRRWRVATSSTTLKVRAKPRGGSMMSNIDPGDIVETFGNDEDLDYHFLLQPVPGFIAKRGKKGKGKERLEPLEYHHDSVMCPMIYQGWSKATGSAMRHTYAPTALVFAQQLWNAMQIFQLFLLLACSYEFSQHHPQVSRSVHSGRKWAVRLSSLIALLILPFSVYLISPGARIFSFIALPIQLLAILTPVSHLRVSIGEHDTDAIGDANSNPWTISREETIACICNLGSSLYNYAGSIKTWPHWKRHFYKIDAFLDWPTSGDCTVDENFTMGISNMRMPLFVARATGSRTGAQVFLLVWSLLPFLYVSYFLCMFVLAPLSPGKNIQRAFCLYGICHFLFFTDVVSYRYGRGMYSPHGEFFHWLEKFAWRVAILMPIYQNCTNGHWQRGHRRVPLVGKVLRWILMVWFVFFVVFQVIQSDIIKFSQYLLDYRQEGLTEMAGLDDTFFFRSVLYPYREALVTMIIMYALLHCCGFTTFRIFVRRVGSDIVESGSRVSDSETAALLTKADSDE